LRAGTGVQRGVAEIGVAVFHAAEHLLGQLGVHTRTGCPAESGPGSVAGAIIDALLGTRATCRGIKQDRIGRRVAETGTQGAFEAIARIGRSVAAIDATVADIAFNAVYERAALEIVAAKAAKQPAV